MVSGVGRTGATISIALAATTGEDTCAPSARSGALVLSTMGEPGLSIIGVLADESALQDAPASASEGRSFQGESLDESVLGGVRGGSSLIASGVG